MAASETPARPIYAAVRSVVVALIVVAGLAMALFSLFVLLMITLIHVYNAWEERERATTRDWLSGARPVEVESLVFTCQQRRIECTDPETLRIFKTRFANSPLRDLPDGYLYWLTLNYRGGVSHTMSVSVHPSDWELYPEGGDGRMPKLVSTAGPDNGRLGEMAGFLMGGAERHGQVMTVDADGVRFRVDRTLIAR